MAMAGAARGIGFGCSGVFITTESWLNAKAQPSERGRVFSIYMVGTFVALALGQLLIGRAEIETAAPFNAIVTLFAVALVMVSTTRAEPPRTTAAATLPYGHLSRAAPVAVVGCVVSGLVSSAFYALVPAWMQGENIDRATIALFMLVAVLGGLVFQVPVGRLSDRFDRRIVLAALSLGFAVAAVALVLLPRSLPMVLTAAALLGGFMSTLYPVCVAFAHDRMPADRVVAVSGRLILVSGLGSVIGPLVGTSLMARFDINGVFYLWLPPQSSWPSSPQSAASPQRRPCTCNVHSISWRRKRHRSRTIPLTSPMSASRQALTRSPPRSADPHGEGWSSSSSGVVMGLVVAMVHLAPS